MIKEKNAGDLLFKMLKPQYEPLEKMLFDIFKDKPELIAKYKAGTSFYKIKVLDRLASELGLS